MREIEFRLPWGILNYISTLLTGVPSILRDCVESSCILCSCAGGDAALLWMGDWECACYAQAEKGGLEVVTTFEGAG